MRTYLNGHWDILPLFEGQDKQSDPSGLANATSQPKDCAVRLTLKGTAIDLKRQITVAPNTTTAVTMAFGTDGLNFWSAEHPNLYNMNIDIMDAAGSLLDRKEERIGFKEVWIDGPDFYVNGKITHFYGDWGHRVHPASRDPNTFDAGTACSRTWA